MAIQTQNVGTSGVIGEVKQGHQAPTTDDPALVATLSPNLPTPRIHSQLSTASTNATLVKVGPATLLGISVMNYGAAARFVRLYDKASVPEPGADRPLMTLAIPPGESKEAAFHLFGMPFLAGMGIAITGGGMDLDATIVSL